MKQHKPWFDKECVGFLDQRKQAKMQWIQVTSGSNKDNLMLADISGTKRRHFRKLKLRNLKLIVRSTMSGTCIGALMTSRGGTSLELL